MTGGAQVLPAPRNPHPQTASGPATKVKEFINRVRYFRGIRQDRYIEAKNEIVLP